MRLASPFTRIAYAVTEQSCTYNCAVQRCPTLDNVLIEVYITLVFRISNPKDFVYNLGVYHFNANLSSAVKDAVRDLVRGIPLTDAYNLRGSNSSAAVFLEHLNNMFSDAGVRFTDSKVANVIIPEDVEKALQAVSSYESKTAEAARQLELQLTRVDKTEAVLLKNLREEQSRFLLNQGDVLKREEARAREMATVAADEKERIEIKATRECETRVRDAEADRDTRITKAKEVAAVMKKRSAASAEADRIEVQRDIDVLKAREEGKVERRALDAEALRATASAESENGPRLREVRQMDREEERLDAAVAILSSAKVFVSGADGAHMMSDLMRFPKLTA